MHLDRGSVSGRVGVGGQRADRDDGRQVQPWSGGLGCGAAALRGDPGVETGRGRGLGLRRSGAGAGGDAEGPGRDQALRIVGARLSKEGVGVGQKVAGIGDAGPGEGRRAAGDGGERVWRIEVEDRGGGKQALGVVLHVQGGGPGAAGEAAEHRRGGLGLRLDGRVGAQQRRRGDQAEADADAGCDPAATGRAVARHGASSQSTWRRGRIRRTELPVPRRSADRSARSTRATTSAEGADEVDDDAGEAVGLAAEADGGCADGDEHDAGEVGVGGLAVVEKREERAGDEGANHGGDAADVREQQDDDALHRVELRALHRTGETTEERPGAPGDEPRDREGHHLRPADVEPECARGQLAVSDRRELATEPAATHRTDEHGEEHEHDSAPGGEGGIGAGGEAEHLGPADREAVKSEHAGIGQAPSRGLRARGRRC